ncbi:MAG: hypothetical protein ACRD8W_17810, partial [Nitrososphaeraceae archaeon]
MPAAYIRRKQLTNVSHEILLEKETIPLTLELSNRSRKAFNKVSHVNVSTIANYIQYMKIEINLSDHYRRDLILLLCKFSKYNNNKSFKDLIREDILAFLNSFVKT